VLYRPADGSTVAAPELAPLLIRKVEGNASGETSPVVLAQVSEAHVGGGLSIRRTYFWRASSAADGAWRGIRTTYGADGYPLAHEILSDSSGLSLLFVDAGLEERAAEAYGPPLAGRRYSVERATEDAPDTIVAGLFEPGATPLGPFVYLSAERQDVVAVICRCMPSRVDDIVETREYVLREVAPADDVPAWPVRPLGERIRFPDDRP